MGKKFVILMDTYGDRVRLCSTGDDEAALMKEAKYQVQRRIEKDGWEVDRVVIGEDIPETTVRGWIDDYWDEQSKNEKRSQDAHDKSEYERLKKKFGGR